MSTMKQLRTAMLKGFCRLQMYSPTDHLPGQPLPAQQELGHRWRGVLHKLLLHQVLNPPLRVCVEHIEPNPVLATSQGLLVLSCGLTFIGRKLDPYGLLRPRGLFSLLIMPVYLTLGLVLLLI